MMKLKFVSVVISALIAVSAVGSTSPEALEEGQTGYVYYESDAGDATLNGKILLPENIEERVPAIIIVHGSGGIGYREDACGDLFRDNGYATMVIDMFGPRNFTAMSGKNVGSSQDIFDAFNVLIQHPNVDPDQISVMGWSWSANLTVSSTLHTKEKGNGHTLKSMVSMYPNC
jgi:dienelactone hydrolase